MSSSNSNSSNLSSGSSGLSLDHQQLPPSEQLCYVHCNFCDTVLAVSVPSISLFKSVMVRCGHCSNLLPAKGLQLLQPPVANHLGHNLLSPSSNHLLMGEMHNPAPTNFSFNQHGAATNYMAPTSSSRGGANQLPRPPTITRPPEKRQRVPSAYNRFIKEEIQRIKAGNPDISHREAFSAAAKNWAHFPHIHFGLMPDQTVKRTSNMRPHPHPHPHPHLHHPQETGEVARVKHGYFAASANVGVSPY